MSTHQKEIAEGQRFEFGKNWTRFLRVLNDERIAIADYVGMIRFYIDLLQRTQGQ